MPPRRYFVVAVDEAGALKYVLAETPREAGDEGAGRDSSVGGGIGGSSTRVMTDLELAEHPDGPAVLAAWQSGDDARFHRDTAGLRAGEDEHRERPVLRLVRPTDRRTSSESR